jgi:hypothetical protein
MMIAKTQKAIASPMPQHRLSSMGHDGANAEIRLRLTLWLISFRKVPRFSGECIGTDKSPGLSGLIMM